MKATDQTIQIAINGTPIMATYPIKKEERIVETQLTFQNPSTQPFSSTQATSKSWKSNFQTTY